jgi:hypothetical protein
MYNKIVLLALLMLPSCTILSACVHIFVLWQLQRQIYTLRNLKQRIAHHCCKCKSHSIMNPCSSFELTKFNFMRYVNLIHAKTCWFQVLEGTKCICYRISVVFGMIKHYSNYVRLSKTSNGWQAKKLEKMKQESSKKRLMCY